jgi:ornithine cyclodeaminase
VEGRWITEADVVELVGLGDAIAAVEHALGHEAAGTAHTMDKTHLAWGEYVSTLHAIGGQLDGLVGTKTWAHTAGGATPLLVLWDGSTGALVAVVEAFALGQLRTGAMSGVATRWLARSEASVMAMLGSGKQALAQVAAVAAVRPLAGIRVWSRSREHADAFARGLGAAGAVSVDVVPTPAEAARDADVVTTATRAIQPIVTAAMLAPGTHVNAVGAITAERRELDADVVARCDVVAADSPDAARRLATEMTGVSVVTPLSAILAAGTGRPDGADLTLFKAMGIGLADIALGAEIVRRAVAHDRGRPLPAPVTVPLDLRIGGAS